VSKPHFPIIQRREVLRLLSWGDCCRSERIRAESQWEYRVIASSMTTIDRAGVPRMFERTMPIENTEPLVYLRGDFMPASRARIAIYDAAVVLGATVTDLARTFRHQPFRLEDHVARLYRSCRCARIPPPVPAEETLRVSRELVARNAALIDAAQSNHSACRPGYRPLRIANTGHTVWTTKNPPGLLAGWVLRYPLLRSSSLRVSSSESGSSSLRAASPRGAAA
jgi:hypothetical protein